MERFPAEVQRWSSDDLHNWLKIVGMTDLIPYLTDKGITSGQHLLRLSENDVMAWSEVPVNRKSQVLQLISGNRPLNARKEAKKKGIFETLSRRRKSAPHPIPADYSQEVDRSLPCMKPGDCGNNSVIFVGQSHIQPKVREQVANDWGSEFSDSDTEAGSITSSLNTDTSKPNSNSHPQRCRQPPALLNKLFEKPPILDPGDLHHYDTQLDIYEQPEFDREGKVFDSRDTDAKATSSNRSHALLSRISTDPNAYALPPNLSDLAKEDTVRTPAAHVHLKISQARRNTGSLTLAATTHSVNAKEVADKLNILLANHGTKNAFTNQRHWSEKPYFTDNCCRNLERQSSCGGIFPSEEIPAVSCSTVNNSDSGKRLQSNSTAGAGPGMRDELDCFPWYHGNIDRNEAKFRLESGSSDGAFLVRKSRKGAQKFASPYSLSLMSAGKVYHLTIRLRPQDGNFALGFEKPGEETFDSVKELVDHHLINPVYLTECDRGVLLSLV